MQPTPFERHTSSTKLTSALKSGSSEIIFRRQHLRLLSLQPLLQSPFIFSDADIKPRSSSTYNHIAMKISHKYVPKNEQVVTQTNTLTLLMPFGISFPWLSCMVISCWKVTPSLTYDVTRINGFSTWLRPPGLTFMRAATSASLAKHLYKSGGKSRFTLSFKTDEVLKYKVIQKKRKKCWLEIPMIRAVIKYKYSICVRKTSLENRNGFRS